MKDKSKIHQSKIQAGGNVVAGDLTSFTFVFNFFKDEVVSSFLGEETASAVRSVVSSGMESIVDIYMNLKKIRPADTRVLKICGYLALSAACMKELNFREAFLQISNAVHLVNAVGGFEKNKLYKEYFLIGFIFYSSTNNSIGLRSLKDSLDEVNDADLQRIAMDALQEQDSKELALTKMEHTANSLRSFYERLPKKGGAEVANSLGLAYRRIGERGNVELLDKAVAILSDGISLLDRGQPGRNLIEAELLNNIGIALIRKFEINGNEQYLNEAESYLNRAMDCSGSDDEQLEPQELNIKGNIYNNIGNLWKQRYSRTNGIIDYKNSTFFYKMAEKFWSEEVFPYHWSIVQKNKADLTLLFFFQSGERELLLSSIRGAISALTFRDFVNSPYQWVKTVRILFVALSCGPSLFETLSDGERTVVANSYRQFAEHESEISSACDADTARAFVETRAIILESNS